MKAFMGKDFMLSSETGKELYHSYAADMPIIDYHCHINPQDIAEDRHFENLTQLWLGGGGYGDHYKWRLMRANGVKEELITGNGDEYEKFAAYAKMLPRAAGNPVYHWTHLELRRYFDCDLILSEDTAEEIWQHCCEKLKDPAMSAQGIIKGSNVVGLATTDDPVDSLEWHEKIAANKSFGVPVRPAWRPDRLMNLNMEGFTDYINALGKASGTVITDMDSLKQAVLLRMDHFDRLGCCASDHGLERIEAIPATAAELDAILKTRLDGHTPSVQQQTAYQYAMLQFMGGEYARRGWVMEIHFGAVRNNNTSGFRSLGPDTGYDAIAPSIQVSGLPRLLDELNKRELLPKTILFSLNPGDNAMLNTICGCFQQQGSRGHVQQGSAWWFNDTVRGMREQIATFADTSLLGNFLGMVTDSRSLLSYPRHEYFRRILCDLIGSWVDSGEYPGDMKHLGGLVQDISYNNTKEFFGF